VRHAAAAACLALAFATPSRAQSQQPPASPDFLTRYDFHLSANAMSTDDERFTWDAHYGGDLDVFDYVTGRTSVLVDYEAVLGEELRPFDPRQALYVLEASSSYRAGRTEIAGVFHHVSRHLSDRPKAFPIAWNVLGGRVLRRFEAGNTTVDARVEAGGLVQHSFVDYTWTGSVDLLIRRPLNPRVGFFAHGFGEIFGVDQTVANRTMQRGGRIEAGVRLSGRAGALELFAGAERRVDADPEERLPHQWAIAGFRLVSP
jgi:hypothetical protein